MQCKGNSPGFAKAGPSRGGTAADPLLASFLLLLVLSIDLFFFPFFYVLENPEGYPERQVEELVQFTGEKGIGINPIQVIRTRESAPAQDGETLFGASSCAWTTFHTGTHERKIWLQPHCENSYQIIAHETAHQVMFAKGYHEEDHHLMTEFLYWEFCLTTSAKFHTNLCFV